MSTYYSYKKDSYDKKKEKDCKLIVECGKSFNRSLPPILNDNPNNQTMPPVKLASVTVDTRSLTKQCVLVEYSSIINAVSVVDSDTSIALGFRLTRECKNKETKVLQEWEYVESSLQDTDGERVSNDAFTVTFCECLDCYDIDCCTYTMELVMAAPSLDGNGNPETLYNITNKNISAIVSCEDCLKCGKPFNRSLPPILNPDLNNPTMPPVKLASITVDTRSLRKPFVNIKYSSIISALVPDFPSMSPDVQIILRFRLIRECKDRETEVLQEWEYIEHTLEDEDGNRESKDTFTISFCDYLDHFDSDCCTYTIELIRAVPTLVDSSPGVLYNITNKDISAILSCNNQLKCGKIFDPDLPAQLNDDPDNLIMPPVKLASVTVDTKNIPKPCVNIEYSSVIDALATMDEVNDVVPDITLKFRLIRECKSREAKVLQEWEYTQGNLEDESDERESKDFFTVTFCECLDCFDDECCTYTMELIQATPRILDGNISVIYNITNKNISAIVDCKSH